jgi:D-alanyl-D-alanine carboxypeptidase
MTGASGGHALITTAADLVRFLERLRSGALFDRPETLETMFAFAPATDTGDQGGYLRGYGLGTLRLDVEGNIFVGHLGGTAGYVGLMLYAPETDRYAAGFLNILGELDVAVPVMTRLAQP